jgi:acyl-CoA hydrolase
MSWGVKYSWHEPVGRFSTKSAAQQYAQQMRESNRQAGNRGAVKVVKLRDNPRKKMTKLQRRLKAHHAARKRAKARAAHALLKQMNPAGTMKKITGVRVRKLKGGGVSVTPVKAQRRAAR